jgi:hypothetical protein
MLPQERQEKILAVLRDIRLLLAREADLGVRAATAAQAGSLDRLADLSEELLTCHVQYAVYYRRFLGLWIRLPADGMVSPAPGE